MNTIERDKAYADTKKYIQDIYFKRYITNEIRYKINELYGELTIDNFNEIENQVKNIFSDFEKSVFKENELKNQLHEKIIYHKLSLVLIILGLLVFMIPYSPFYSAHRTINKEALKAWLILLSISLFIMFILYFIKSFDTNQKLLKIIHFLENLFVILFLLVFSLLLPMIASYFGIII